MATSRNYEHVFSSWFDGQECSSQLTCISINPSLPNGDSRQLRAWGHSNNLECLDAYPHSINGARKTNEVESKY